MAQCCSIAPIAHLLGPSQSRNAQASVRLLLGERPGTGQVAKGAAPSDFPRSPRREQFMVGVMGYFLINRWSEARIILWIVAIFSQISYV